MPTDFPGSGPAAGSSVNPGGFLDELVEDTTEPNKIVNKSPVGRYRLTFLDATCLIINRMIGTGIFESPQKVMIGTGSTGASLLFWFAGIPYCLAGAHVYVEYGLNVPRYVIDGVEQSVPRSGGDLHYLQYVYRKPRYKPDTVLLIGCLYGISFICVGNMAGNSIICALRLLQAANPDASADSFAAGTIRGFAIAIAIFSCFIHSFSRRGGILLNNLLALVKVGILLLIIFTTIAVAAGGLHKASDGAEVQSQFRNNTAAAFAHASDDSNGYAQAFLSIVFAFSGWDQSNYVLGEIRQPRKTFPRSVAAAVTTVSVLYMAVNLCYMAVVPAADQKNRAFGSVAQQFFENTFGALSSDPAYTSRRVVNVFLALSSFGNIVGTTYTAARMKQEIAKQGFIPKAKFFAQNKDVSFGRLLKWLEKFDLRIPFLNPDYHSERTPVGALVLHLFSSLVLILATYNLSPEDAWHVLTGLGAYLITALFGALLAMGILLLHFRGPPATAPVVTKLHPGPPNQRPVPGTWAGLTRGTVAPWASVTAAAIYLIGNVYPVLATWVPPSSTLFGTQTLAWYVVPVTSCCLLAFGSLWFLGFLGRARLRRTEEFRIERQPEFDRDDGAGGENTGSGGQGDGGGLILIHETVTLSWPSAHGDGFKMEELHGNTKLADFGGYESRHRGLTDQPARTDYSRTDFATMA